MLSLSPEKYKSMLKYAKANFEEVKKYLRPDDLLLESIIENLQGGKNA